MKILHITPSYKPAWIYGGPTLSISRLAEAQAMVAPQIDVLTTTANGTQELAVTKNSLQLIECVNVYYYPRWTGDHSHFSPALLWQLWRKARQYDIIHIHSWWNLVTIPAVLICWLQRIKPILSPRGMLSPYSLEQKKGSLKHIFHNLLGIWLLKQTILHATSGQEADEALAFLPKWPHFVAPNIITLPNRSDEVIRSVDNNLLRLVFLSRIHPKKGLDLLLPALAALDFPWQLDLIGTGDPSYESELKAQATLLGIDQHLKWLGWIEGPAKYELLSQADLMVLPSRNENFANVVLESLSVGTPVLITNKVGLSEYIVKKNLGWVSSPDSLMLEQTLKSAYMQINKSISQREAIARIVHTDFTQERIAQQYLDAYSKFCHV